MISNNRTAWTEGMFLGPQHFQQHDRFLLNTIAAVSAASESYPFGLLELSIDDSALAEGKFALSRASGVFPDGTPFNLPEEGDLPVPLNVDPGTREAILFLAIPYVSSSDKDAAVEKRKENLSQYIVKPNVIADRQTEGSTSEETVFTASLWTRLLSGSDQQPAYHTLPVAKVVERRDDGTVSLDKTFYSCALSVQASAQLTSHCHEITGLMTQRASQLARTLGQPTASDTSQLTQFVLLQIINRVLPLLRHLQTLPTLHPERLYRELSQLIGELSTITSSSRQCPELPEYNHRHQHKSFIPIINQLRESLNWIPDTKVETIPVVNVRGGTYTATVPDLHLFNTARFILAVKAQLTPDELSRRFPNQTTISSKAQIKQIVQAQGQGVELQPLVTVPNSIPMYERSVYFEIRPDNPLWSEISTSGIIAMHVAGTFDDLNMQLWTVPR